MSRKAEATSGGDIPLEDSARAEIWIPMGAETVFEFVSDIGRLLRLNPHLAIEIWQPVPGCVRFAAMNETTGLRIETDVRIEIDLSARSVVLRYSDGLKQATTLMVEQGDGHGCRLVVTEHYQAIADTDDPRVAEVDRSLVPWVMAIGRHLFDRQRWGRLPGWRWWNEHLLPGMPPGQRRIVRMILWISALEFVVFVFVAAIFWAERQGS